MKLVLEKILLELQCYFMQYLLSTFEVLVSEQREVKRFHSKEEDSMQTMC